MSPTMAAKPFDLPAAIKAVKRDNSDYAVEVHHPSYLTRLLTLNNTIALRGTGVSAREQSFNVKATSMRKAKLSTYGKHDFFTFTREVGYVGFAKSMDDRNIEFVIDQADMNDAFEDLVQAKWEVWAEKSKMSEEKKVLKLWQALDATWYGHKHVRKYWDLKQERAWYEMGVTLFLITTRKMLDRYDNLTLTMQDFDADDEYAEELGVMNRVIGTVKDYDEWSEDEEEGGISILHNVPAITRQLQELDINQTQAVRKVPAITTQLSELDINALNGTSKKRRITHEVSDIVEKKVKATVV